MKYKAFTELWQTFSQDQKDEWKADKPSSTSASTDEVVDEIDAALDTAVIDEE